MVIQEVDVDSVCIVQPRHVGNICECLSGVDPVLALHLTAVSSANHLGKAVILTDIESSTMTTTLISLHVYQHTWVRVGGRNVDTLQATLYNGCRTKGHLAHLLLNDSGHRSGRWAHPATRDRRYHEHFIHRDLQWTPISILHVCGVKWSFQGTYVDLSSLERNGSP